MALTTRANEWWNLILSQTGILENLTGPATIGSTSKSPLAIVQAGDAVATAIENLSTAMTTLNSTLTTLNSNISTMNGHLNDLKTSAATTAAEFIEHNTIQTDISATQATLKTLSETTGHRTEGAYTSSTLPTLYKLLIEQGVILEDTGVLPESEQQRAAAAITDYIAKAKTAFQPFE